MNDSIVVKRKPITYDHESVYYVPVFQKDFDEEGNLTYSPTFVYSLLDATEDQQMAASFDPDYILELKGHFKATTKDLIIKDE